MRFSKKMFAAVAVAGLALTSGTALAQNITYTGSDTQAGISVNYSITTDGAFGTLSLDDIISSSVSFSPGSNPSYSGVMPASADGSLYFSNTNVGAVSPVSATASNLLFDFGNMGGLNICAGNLCYALAAQGINDIDAVVYNHGNLATREIDDLDVTSNLTAGTYTVVSPTIQAFATATTSAVPEAATWAMMMVGLGVVGGSLRRRRSVSTRVSFA